VHLRWSSCSSTRLCRWPCLGALVDSLIDKFNAGERLHGDDGAGTSLTSTRRPDKLHPQVLSQCDNLCPMKTNGSVDLDRLAAYFSAVPRDLLDRAQYFGLGNALFSGGIVAEPTLARMRQRWTPEGGSDVAVPVGPRARGQLVVVRDRRLRTPWRERPAGHRRSLT